MRSCDFTGNGEEIEQGQHIQVVEKATGAVDGTIALIHGLDRPCEVIDAIAKQIVANPDCLDQLGATPGVIDRRNSRPDPYAEDPLEDWAYVERLLKLAKQNCDAGDPILAILRCAKVADADNLVSTPDIGELHRARHAFHAMPVPRQQRILNGWKPEPERPSRREMVEEATQAFIWPVLKLDGHEDGGVWAGRTFRLLDDQRRVHVEIAAGCTFAEAVRTLEAITRLVQARWEKLIAIYDFMLFDRTLRGHMAGEDNYEG